MGELNSAEYGPSIERSRSVLWNNGYPGRWLAIGRGEGIHEEELFLAYSFGGRSDGSKNRIAVPEGTAIRLIAPGADGELMAQASDAALIYYHQSDTAEGVFVVSNGAQTRPVLDAVYEGETFEDAVTNAPVQRGMVDGEEKDVDLSSYEPDSPINTARITGVVDLREEAQTPLGLAVVRKDLETGDPIRTFYTARLEELEPGQGWAIQTYGKNDPKDRETPVPSFDQPPYGFDIRGGTTEIASRVRMAIGEETFAAAVVRAIDISRRQFAGSTIINTRG